MLDVAGLRVAYGERPVLQGVDLSVSAGEVVGLVGPNGCGKTTLLKAITRVLPWAGGEVLLLGESASKLSRQELSRRVAVVPQNPALPVGYTALEVVLMGRTPHLGFLEQEGAEDYCRAREALRRVGALDLADRRVDELSAGERQNVVLARALAQETPILLLDEPTANLDPLTEKQMLETLFDVMRQKTTLLITHRLVGLENVDEIVVLDRGCILERGTHGRLIQENGLYRRLWDLQNRMLDERIS